MSGDYQERDRVRDERMRNVTTFADLEHFTEARGWVDADKWRLHLAERGITLLRPRSQGLGAAFGGVEPPSPLNYSDAAAFAEALGFLHEPFSDGTTRLYIGPRRVDLLKAAK